MIKLEKTNGLKRLHLGDLFKDLNEAEYQELCRIVSTEANDGCVVRELGTPKTVGELSSLLSFYTSTTPFGFRNQPAQTLCEVIIGREKFIAFQEKEARKNVR